MLIDVLIIIFAISSVVRGKEIGFVRQLFSTIGFFGGLFIGTYLQPFTVTLVHSSESRSIVTIVTTLGSALILLALGEYIGAIVKHKVMQRNIDSVDNVLGSVLSLISLLVSIWLTVAIINSLPLPTIQEDFRESRIITALDRFLPSAPSTIADIGKLIDPNGFPQVFIGSEPTPSQSVALPTLGALSAAVADDRASVDKVVGQGCGGIVEGSSFIVGNNLLVTNAHVVAGIRHPYVDDTNGTHSATVISFDPNLDLAILRVHNLAGTALPIVTGTVADKTPAAVLGYPGGGPFNAGAAAVLEEFTATGRNIYGSGNTNRSVYEIQADIIPGNSGGPLVNEAGQVIGVVFAESTTYNHVGYALTTSKVVSEINQAKNDQTAVSTGSCAQ
jgi:S1-C subfamily serine protease